MKYFKFVVSVSAAMALSACGGGDSGGKETSTALQCGEPQWQISSQTPFEGLTVTDIDQDALAALTDEAQDTYILATETDSDLTEGSGVVVPLTSIDLSSKTISSTVPTTQRIAFTGAEMDLQLVAGDVTCDGPTITVNAIPKSVDPDATLSSLTDDLGELLLQKASIYGYTNLDELRDARDQFLDGTRIPNTGELPILLALDGYEEVTSTFGTDLSEEDKAILASVLEHIEYPQSVEERREAIADLNNTDGILPQINQPSFTIDTVSAQSSTQKQTSYSTLKQGRSEDTVTAQNSVCAAIRGESVDISSAAQLSYFMRRQKELEESLSGLTQFSREALLATTPVIGVASGGSAAAIGGMVYVEQTLTRLEAGTLPSRFGFQSLSFGLTPGKEIPEDYEQAGKQAEWNNAEVDARSRGFNLTGAALDGLSQVIGVGRWAKGLAANKGIVGTVQGFQGDLIQNEVFSEVKNISEDAECLEIPPQVWEDIDVTDRQWSEAKISQGQSLTLTDAGDNDRNLNLQELGVSSLRLEIKPEPFGGNTIGHAAFIDVVPLKLIPQPGFLRITNLGTTKTLEVALSDSEAPGEPLSAQKVSGDGFIDTQPSFIDITTGHQFNVTTPLQQEGYPMVVQVKRTSPLTGEDRTARITLGTSEDISLTPQSACLESGEIQTFTATVEGADADTSLTWTVDAGSLNEQGFTMPTEEAIYTPPTGSGSATVRVALASDSSVSDSADITYGQCTSELAMHGDYNAKATVPGKGSDENPDDGLTTGPLLPDEPNLPATYWLDRTEETTSLLNVSEAASALANSAVLFQSSIDGTATFELDLLNGSTTCVQETLSDGSFGDVKCGTAEADADWTAKYYLEITEPVTYQFDFEMQCIQTGKGWAQAWIIPTIFRYVGGEDGDGEAIPPNGPTGELASGNFININIDDAMPSSTTTSFDPTQGPINVCKDTLDPVVVSKTFEFGGAVDPNDPDLIILSIMLGQAAVGIDNYDEESTLRPEAVGPISTEGVEEPLGTNDGSASVRIEMRLSEQSP